MAILLAGVASGQGDIKGGWLECRHVVDNTLARVSIYSIKVHTFGATRYPSAAILIYDANTGEPVSNLDSSEPYSDTFTYTNNFSGCTNTTALNNRYRTATVNYILRLPISTRSYFVTASGRVRDGSIVNISGAAGIGILYSYNIWGVVDGVDYHANSSPVFPFMDTISVCRNTPFTCSLNATDPDGDSLSYAFGDAIQSPNDSTSPPLFPVQYNPPYLGTEPMGTGVIIDPVTGIISGTAPDEPGGYNITVYVSEWRQGKLLNVSRKESQIKVVSCPFQAPLLQPLYSSCRVNSFSFRVEPTCPQVTRWHWDFGVTGSLQDTSNLAQPSFTYPPGPGTYILKLNVWNNDGYVDSARSVVKILDSISLRIRPDTAICKTDMLTLRPQSEGTSFAWRESNGTRTLSNYMIKNPVARPTSDTTIYYLTARLNNCVDSARITVFASPYPTANAGADTIICTGSYVRLLGRIKGAFYTWLPVTSLSNSQSLQPVASPSKTISYILSVRDTFYCKKIVSDTVQIKVIPAFTVDAGENAFIVRGQPYQLRATSVGNTEIVKYVWTPSSYLNTTTFSDPVATINNPAIDTMRYKVTATTVVGNCSATDEVLLRVFKIGPDILVPTAFTPGGDGKNDVLKPILIGIRRFDFFSIYNRYGQQLFKTSTIGQGWDGKVKGTIQPAGAYVFTTRGIDFNGRLVLKTGTVILIQ